MNARILVSWVRYTSLVCLAMALAGQALAIDPCCDCPPTALCMCNETPPDCGGSGDDGTSCTDKYGNPVDCPPQPPQPPSTGICYDKYGNPYPCDPDCNDCSCDAYAAIYPEACGLYCYDASGDIIPCPPPPCFNCCENSAYAWANQDQCTPQPLPSPNPPTCPRPPEVTWGEDLMHVNNGNVYAIYSYLHFPGAEGWWSKETVVITDNTCNATTETCKLSPPMQYSDGTIPDVLGTSVQHNPCDVKTAQMVFWGPDQDHVEQCRYPNQQSISVDGNTIKFATFGANKTARKAGNPF